VPDLQKTRTRMIGAIVALLLVDIAAAALLMSPIAGRQSLRQERLRQLSSSLKARESAPWRGLDKKIPQARRDIAAFYLDRFPSGYSVISTSLDKIASETGVRVSSEKYTQRPSDLQKMDRVEIEVDVAGDYVPLMKFINTVERSKLFFIVDEMDLAGEQSGGIKLRIKLETYLRTT